MSFQCLNPYVGISYFTKNDGKKYLKLLSKKRYDYNLQDLKENYGVDNVFVLPCGTCESCRRNKAEDWAIRCQLESCEHAYNYFVTLTFDDLHYMFASKKALSDFLDRLEGVEHKNKFKYLASLEYGDLTHRLHFHLVLFCDFPIDLFNPQKIGNYYHYESKLLNDIWKFGFYTISPFETSCARYVAKYTSKGSKLFMSRNLGKTYFLKHYQEIIDNGFKVYGNFGNSYSAYMPKCFIRWFDEVDPDILVDYKMFKKDLAHLVMMEKLRKVVGLHEEDVISNDKKKVLDQKERRRKLC